MFTTSRFPIELVDYDPTWVRIAERESARLHDALGKVLVEVHHIGSTSVPGLVAKPIVDLVPVVTDLEALDAKRATVEALGYEWRGELGIAGRRYCVLVDAAAARRVAQLHMFATGADAITRHLDFRDYLRAHPEEARAYEQSKFAARALHPDDVNEYNGAKSDWIRGCERRALAWRARDGKP